MSGSLFSAAATLLVGVLFVALIGVGFIWIVPILLVALIPLLSGSLAAKLRTSSVVGASNPAGVPTTGQASYEPTMDPSQRGKG